MLPAQLPRPEHPRHPDRDWRGQTATNAPRPGASKPIAAPMANLGEAETRTTFTAALSLRVQSWTCPRCPQAGGPSHRNCRTSHHERPLSSRHSGAGAESPGEPSRGGAAQPHQPVLSDDRTGTGTDQGAVGGGWEEGASGSGRGSWGWQGPRGGGHSRSGPSGWRLSSCGQQVWRCGHWGDG